MESSYGTHLKITVFGESHAQSIGVTVEGIPPGKEVDIEKLQNFLSRRAPGNSPWSTSRKEPDVPVFLSGVEAGKTNGQPVKVVIENKDVKSTDYSMLKETPRPGHADYTAYVKHKGKVSMQGGGHFSGRLTAPLCVAGGICLQLLTQKDIHIAAHILQIGTVSDEHYNPTAHSIQDVPSVSEPPFPTINDSAGINMQKLIAQAKEEKDSLGGIIECIITGVPAGLGTPMFNGIENKLSAALFGIPAVKGIEFGAGFNVATLKGSQNNDAFYLQNQKIKTKTNNSGGILGGITNGMPILFKVAIKPTPSIGIEQQTVNLETMKEEKITINGRHDPCIVPRAVPVVEAVAATVLLDFLLSTEGECKNES